MFTDAWLQAANLHHSTDAQQVARTNAPGALPSIPPQIMQIEKVPSERSRFWVAAAVLFMYFQGINAT